ncbi:hypothetical protein GCM10025783_28990 [Amnibacterium soli]|uniref:PKD domain-containing protein n=2 Tax=Amnibacterium soli TaxID=1282736 RepID=A0ABP8ZEC4_9MICO
MAAGAVAAATIAGALVAAPPVAAAPAATPGPTASPTATAPAAPRPAGSALAVVLAPGTVLTLPAKDGLRDTTTVRILSGRGGRVDLDAVRGKRTVHLGSRLALRSARTGFSRSVRVDVAKLAAGTWRLRAQRSADHSVRARSAALPVGTGAPVHVGVRPAARTLYPYADGVLDAALVTVTAKDETNAVVPVTGSVRIDAGKQHVTRTMRGTAPVQLPVTALPLGAATVTVKVTGASGGKAVRRTALTLAPTGVGALRIARSSTTVLPVRDGRLDTVALTTTGAASGGSPAKVSGTLTVSRGRTIAAVFPVRSGTQHVFTWNGRVGGTVQGTTTVDGAVVPGTYTVTLALKGPQGPVRTKTAALTVTKEHLPYAVRDLFAVGAGNQQGLAVRNGMFYVGYDTGNDTSRIDLYDGGTLMSSLGPLPISHVAELAYSTTTDRLYAATGGAKTPTKIFVLDPTDPQWGMDAPTDPTAVIKGVYDFSGTLGNNAMVAVDDANKRLLVFSGATGAYSVSSVTLTPSAETDENGVPLVPAGTITATAPVSISGVPQGMDLVGQQLWIYTSTKKVNRVEKYDLTNSALYTAQASTSADLYWGGEGEGMATVAASDTNDGLPAWIFVGAHSAVKGGPNMLGRLVPVTDAD